MNPIIPLFLIVAVDPAHQARDLHRAVEAVRATGLTCNTATADSVLAQAEDIKRQRAEREAFER